MPKLNEQSCLCLLEKGLWGRTGWEWLKSGDEMGGKKKSDVGFLTVVRIEWQQPWTKQNALEWNGQLTID